MKDLIDKKRFPVMLVTFPDLSLRNHGEKSNRRWTSDAIRVPDEAQEKAMKNRFPK
jgi:hypothetical protein